MADIPPQQSFLTQIGRLLHSAAFLTTAVKYIHCPPDEGAEITFIGRSNVGKSTAINCLTQQTQLARKSKTPGRTQALNFFQTSGELRFVDLPGYGYSQATKHAEAQWAQTLAEYFKKRQSLRGSLWLIDIRHPMTKLDYVMAEWLMQFDFPVHILLAKADKISRGEGLQVEQNVRKALRPYLPNVTTQRFSSLKLIGIDECFKQISNWIYDGEE
ncbi:MAG: ribosome biogenesis GTP-binding protein YihA/YsxC [Pseudomonadota bacterium]